jgi:hypothetical protein
MTSRTSSTSDTSRRGSFRFPPRSELPPEVTIRPLPLVGTTWYERGVSYWARRTGIGIIFAAVLVVYPLMIWGALQAVSAPGTALYYGLLTAEVIFTIVTAVLMYSRARRNWLSGKGASRDDTARAGRAARAGSGTGTLAFAAGGLLAGLLVLSSLFTAGLVLAAFAIWMAPVPPMEQYERRHIAERLRVRHGLEQLSPHSKHYGSKNHRKRRAR